MIQRKWTVYSLALGIALGSTSNLRTQAPNFTTIDFPGGAGTQAWAINPRGDIVGSYTLADKSNHGFLLSGARFIRQYLGAGSSTPAVLTDLNTLIPSDSPLYLVFGFGINDTGEIVGLAVDQRTGDTHAFLATPTSSGSSSSPAGH